MEKLSKLSAFISGIKAEEVMKPRDNSSKEFRRTHRYHKDYTDRKIAFEIEKERAFGSEYKGDLELAYSNELLRKTSALINEKERENV